MYYKHKDIRGKGYAKYDKTMQLRYHTPMPSLQMMVRWAFQ